MTEDLKELLRLYAAEQDCKPDEQARCAKAFSDKVKEVARKYRLDHWKVAAHVRKQNDKQRLAEEKRAGKARGAGLPGDSTDPAKSTDPTI